MRKTLPLLTGLVLLVLAAVAHGIWTGRWEMSHAMEEATARVKDVPLAFGAWRGNEIAPDRQAFASAGAIAYWMRVYKNTQTGERMTVLLMCGRAGRMAVHTPDLCYGGAGFTVLGRPVRTTVPTAQPSADFWTARFLKPGPLGDSALTIHWGWSASGPWESPDWPRWYFAGAPFLYKLYVVRDVSNDTEHTQGDASIRFLQDLLPELEKTLFRKDQPSPEKL